MNIQMNMNAKSGNVDGEKWEDDSIPIASNCQDQMDHALKYTLGIE